MMEAVQLEQVSRNYGNLSAVQAVSLAIPPGEVFGLIGPDGAGKTTLLRMIVGALRPTKGRILVFGDSPDKAKTAIGYLPQKFGLYEDLSVRENLLFFGGLYGLRRAAAAGRLEELLALTGLNDFQDRLAKHLSGGMKQKLAVAVALLHEPRLLVLDEPTTGVDPVFRRELWNLLYAQVMRGLTIVISTPYLDEADRCHRVGLLRRGRLTMVERSEAAAGSWFRLSAAATERWLLWNWLKQQPQVAEVHFAGEYLRGQLRAEADWNTLTAAAEAQIPGHRLEPAIPELEDLFLQAAMEEGEADGFGD